jgi:hypothetical protein
VLDVAIRRPDGSTAIDLGVRGTPPLPVSPALRQVLPDGLRRGSTVAVSGSVSLLLALLGAASEDGAWCALVGFPRISAEAAAEYRIDLTRLALVPTPGTGWTTAVGALVDALDLIAVRPPARLLPGDVRRLSARVRTREAVLVPFGEWPGADVRLTAGEGQWEGVGQGSGRLRCRRLSVHAEGRGTYARPRSAELVLPADGGGVREAPPAVEPVRLAG